MEQDEHDPRIARIAAALRPLPAVDGEAKARVLVAVAAEREAHRERGRREWRRPRVWAGGAFLAAAAALVAIWIQGGVQPTPSEVLVPPIATAGSVPPAMLATRDAAAEPAAVPVELMLNAPAARRVRLVGDFTGWDEKGVEMRRDAASGLWSTTASVRPGRHVYAFIVDDSIWMRDPRAPVAPDSDFGQPGSLLIVGRP
jgi:hypothetical protein